MICEGVRFLREGVVVFLFGYGPASPHYCRVRSQGEMLLDTHKFIICLQRDNGLLFGQPALNPSALLFHWPAVGMLIWDGQPCYGSTHSRQADALAPLGWLGEDDEVQATSGVVCGSCLCKCVCVYLPQSI